MLQEERQELKEYIGNAIRNNESNYSAFAVDRSQQVLYEIRNGMNEGTIQRIHVLRYLVRL